MTMKAVTARVKERLRVAQYDRQQAGMEFPSCQHSECHKDLNANEIEQRRASHERYSKRKVAELVSRNAQNYLHKRPRTPQRTQMYCCSSTMQSSIDHHRDPLFKTKQQYLGTE